MRRSRVLVILGVLALPRVTPGQDVQVTWHDQAPRQGAFAWVILTAAPGPVFVAGTIAGLPLPFSRASRDRFVALAAVPLAAEDSVTVSLRLEFARGRVRDIERRLPVIRARLPVERLSVDPRFTRPPDSALQARIARETELARGVTEQALATRRLWSTPFVAPRAGRVTSVFGIGRVFNGQLRSRHLGTDFDGAVGAPVVAANRGVVALVGDFYYAGRALYVNHGAGLITAYLHLSDVVVAAGDTVDAGQLIGRVGASGRVTGPHLHWAVRVGPSPVDGQSLLALPPLERLFER